VREAVAGATTLYPQSAYSGRTTDFLFRLAGTHFFFRCAHPL